MSFSSFFGFRPRKRDYSSIYCSDFHILVLIHSTEKNTTFHYHSFLLSCKLWILSFFPKVLWVFFVEVKPLFSHTGKKQCY